MKISNKFGHIHLDLPRDNIAFAMKHLSNKVSWVGLVLLVLMGMFACITPVTPKQAETVPNNKDVVDTPKLSGTSTSTQIRITWKTSNLNEDNFGLYEIMGEGLKQDGTKILPNARIITSRDTLYLDFFNLVANTSYTFQLTVKDKKGNVHGMDAILIFTSEVDLEYTPMGNYSFPEDESIIDFAVPQGGGRVLVATNTGIYEFDPYLSVSPIIKIKSDQIREIASSPTYFVYATATEITATNNSTGQVSSYLLNNVKKIKINEDELTMVVCTPDSVLALTLNTPTLEDVPGFRHIILTNKHINDFICFPKNSTNYYLATDEGVFYFDPLGNSQIPRPVATAGEKSYKTLAGSVNTSKMVIGRYPKNTDLGLISYLDGSSNSIDDIKNLSKISSAGLVYVDQLHIDAQGIITMVANGKMYFYGLNLVSHENDIFTVPSSANTSSGYSTLLHIENDYDYYIAGKNKISVFHWRATN